MSYIEEEEYMEYIERGRTLIWLLLGSLTGLLCLSCTLYDHAHLSLQ